MSDRVSFSWGNLPVSPSPFHWSAGADTPPHGDIEIKL